MTKPDLIVSTFINTTQDHLWDALTNRVLAVEPKTRIEMEFTPKWSDTSSPTSRAVYLIAPSGKQMRLTVEHYALSEDMGGIHDGWTRFLSGLKTWIETGGTVRFSETPA